MAANTREHIQYAASSTSTNDKDTLPSFSERGSSLGLSRTLTKRLNIRNIKASGPGSIFNPTKIRMGVRWRGSNASKESSPDIALLWRSRDNRKGRNSIAVPRIISEQPSAQFPDGAPRPSGDYREILKGTLRMFTTFPYWDMAFWTALWFNIGSLLWIINGLFDWLPVAYPSTEFSGETTYCYGLTALIGVIAYMLGAFMAYLEAVNYGSLYGSILRRLLDDHANHQKQIADEKLRTFFDHIVPRGKIFHVPSTSNNGGVAARRHSLKVPVERRGALDFGQIEGQTRGYESFRLVPTLENFKAYHLYEIGFIACTVQFIGATIFLVPGIASLPGIMDRLGHWEKNVVYWIPEIIASAFFVPSSWLFMLENQDRWWKPNTHVLGWWIGLFALIGSLGFVVSSALGPATYTNHGAEYHSTLSCLWGAICFWISSLLQQYEAVNKNVVERLKETEIRPLAHPV